jgi:hypothetical protein
MNLLDYTKKKVISLKDAKCIIDAKITGGRKMPRRGKGWFLDSSEDGILYANNPVIRVKGVGKKAEKLLRRNGIKTVAILRTFTVKTLNDIAQRPDNGLTVKALK